MSTRTRITAEYLYPGSFFPESITRELPDSTLQAAIEHGPDEEGYFKKDGWFGVVIRKITEKRYVADDGDETWLREGKPIEWKVIVGDVVHVDDPLIAGDRFDILRSNIRSNSREPHKDLAVHTRCGNFQIASDWDQVVATT